MNQQKELEYWKEFGAEKNELNNKVMAELKIKTRKLKEYLSKKSLNMSIHECYIYHFSQEEEA